MNHVEFVPTSIQHTVPDEKAADMIHMQPRSDAGPVTSPWMMTCQGQIRKGT